MSLMYNREPPFADLVGMSSMLNPGSCIFVVVEMSVFSLDSKIHSILKSMGQFDKKICSSSKCYCKGLMFKWEIVIFVII